METLLEKPALKKKTHRERLYEQLIGEQRFTVTADKDLLVKYSHLLVFIVSSTVSQLVLLYLRHNFPPFCHLSSDRCTETVCPMYKRTQTLSCSCRQLTS